MKKRILALLLCLVLALSFLPAAFAEPEDGEDLPTLQEPNEKGDGQSSEQSMEELSSENDSKNNAELPDAENIFSGKEDNQEESDTATEASDLFELEEPEISEENDEEITECIVYINPLYQDIITEDDLVESFEHQVMFFSLMAADEEPSIVFSSDIAKCAKDLREKLCSRIDEIKIGYSTTDESFRNEKAVRDAVVRQIWDNALVHTGVPNEGDYIRWQYYGMKAYISFSTKNGVTNATIRYVVTFMSDADQEEETTQAVSDLIEELGLNSLSDYEKLRAIYFWICENITYDTAGAAAGADNTLCHTAYSAVVQHRTVCQGYALLIYRLALECGIDARLIAGKSNGQNHGWNIVKLGNLYYYLDSTWDAAKDVYAYFLSGTQDFANHSRFDEYTTASFNSAYPMGANRPTHLNRQGTCDSFDYSTQLPGMESTCSKHGYEGASLCPFCGATTKEQTLLPYAEHTPVIDEAVAATKENTGLSEGTHCEVCGTVLQPQKVIPALPEVLYPVQIEGISAGMSVFVGERSFTANEEGIIMLEDPDQTIAISYTWSDAGDDPHTVYPTGMKLFRLTNNGQEYSAEHLPGLDNLLSYCGNSIRLSGSQGIRMITGIPAAMKKQLMTSGVEGYKLLETGTVVAFEAQLTDLELTRNSAAAKSARAFLAGVSDPVFATTGGLSQFTNVLTGFSSDQCSEELIFRPYAVLQAEDGSTVTVYGGTVTRSIGYVAWQNRKVYSSGSAEYQYVWMLIHTAYGNLYETENRG